MDRRTLMVPLLCLSVQTAIAGGPGPGGNPPATWQPLLDWLRSERDRMSADLETAHARLRALAEAAGDEELLERLWLEPPQPRPIGYGILPEIREDKPVEMTEPTLRKYSLETLSVNFPREFRDAALLAGRAAIAPDLPLEPAVAEFERLRDRMRILEDHLDYHAKWQLAVLESAAFFKRKNEIVKLVREMERSRNEGGAEEQIAELYAKVLERLATFVPAPGLTLERRGDGTLALPVTVWTDIEDEAFLESFREITETVFAESADSREMRFTIELRLQRYPVAKLYPEGAPAHGTAIDVSEHRKRFPEGRLILTTGAESTHAWAGRSVILGSTPITRNALAHEFAHLLGFSDMYLRGFDGETGGEFGVVLLEWSGLHDDLMGWPAGGSVSKRMIAKLIEAYGAD